MWHWIGCGEDYTAVYLSERIPLPKVLNIDSYALALRESAANVLLTGVGIEDLLIF
jgi:hypothetical protein